ncbi:MAG: pilus assembly protein [Lachnospiraceae bacterium]|nr:pilus assembly protein [Lachnospiraceae bacterium]
MIKSEKGQAIVETALVLPILLLLLGAILDFGWIFANTYRAEHAAGVGARYAAIYAADMSGQELKDAVREKVLENVWTDEENTTTNVWLIYDSVTVRVESRIKTLTFVANTIFGDYYTAKCSVTASF